MEEEKNNNSESEAVVNDSHSETTSQSSSANDAATAIKEIVDNQSLSETSSTEVNHDKSLEEKNTSETTTLENPLAENFSQEEKKTANETNEVVSEKQDNEIAEKKLATTTVSSAPNTANSLEVVKEKAKFLVQSKKFWLIVGVIVIIIVLVYWWLANQKNTKDNFVRNDITIKVDGAKQEGKVNIIDEFKEETTTDKQLVVTTTDYVIIAYYPNTKQDPNMEDCSKVYPLKRRAEKKYDSNIVNTVRGLLFPLSTEEKEQGFVSAIPDKTFLQYIKIDNNGTAEVNFSGQIAKVAGSCAVTAIRSQITETLMQFPAIKKITICINGNCKQEEILQP